MTPHQLELAITKAKERIASVEQTLKEDKRAAVAAKDLAGKARASFKVAKKQVKVARAAFRKTKEEAEKAASALEKLTAKAKKAAKKTAKTAKAGSANKLEIVAEPIGHDRNGHDARRKVQRKQHRAKRAAKAAPARTAKPLRPGSESPLIASPVPPFVPGSTV